MSQTILLIDDDPDAAMIFPAVLEYHGYRVLVAQNGLDGIRVAQRERPELVLMDLEMPVVDGLMATEILRDNPSTAEIPVVAFTIHDRVRRGRTLFDGYLVKPCPWDRVLAEIERLIGPPERRPPGGHSPG